MPDVEGGSGVAIAPPVEAPKPPAMPEAPSPKAIASEPTGLKDIGKLIDDELVDSDDALQLLAKDPNAFINQAKLHDPTPEEWAQGAVVTPIEATPSPITSEPSPDEEAAIARAKTILNPEATPPDIPATPEATVPTSAAESPVAEAVIPAPTAESTTLTTETTTTPESTAPAEQMAKMAEIEAKLSELGIPLDSEEGKEVIKNLSENQDLITEYSEKFDKAKEDAAKAIEFVKELGHTPLSEGEAMQFAFGLIAKDLTTDIAKLTEEASSDPANAEEKEKKNVLLRILIATLKGIGKVALGVATGAAVGGLTGGAAAIGSLGKK